MADINRQIDRITLLLQLYYEISLDDNLNKFIRTWAGNYHFIKEGGYIHFNCKCRLPRIGYAYVTVSPPHWEWKDIKCAFGSSQMKK